MKVNETRSVGAAARVGKRPERAPSEAAKPAQASGDAASVMGIPESELTPRVRGAIVALMEEVARLREELKATKHRTTHLEELADTDTLVPLINRRAFVRELSRMMSYAQRYGTPHALVYFDLNGMKAINDTHGHAAGDAALKHVADILTEQTRESDVVGRLGGDEFGVLLAQADDATAHEKADTLAETIGTRALDWKGIKIALSVAYGVHSIQSGQDADDALHAADRAMYAHKSANAGPKRAAGGG